MATTEQGANGSKAGFESIYPDYFSSLSSENGKIFGLDLIERGKMKRGEKKRAPPRRRY